MIKSSLQWSFLCVVLSFLSPLTSSNSQAELRLSIPEETFGPPFYARLEFPSVDPALIPTNGEWAALILYRERQCIPESFNLLALFDVPAAFDCPLSSFSGYEVYRTAPGVDQAPVHTRLTGEGEVSIWFVRLEEFEQAAVDGMVTIVDFENMPSLRKGNADFFEELIRPSQVNMNILLHANAYGQFQEGGGFRLTYTVTGNPQVPQIGTQVRTRIEFPAVAYLPADPPLSSPFTGLWFDPSNPGSGISIHPVRGRDQISGSWNVVDASGEQKWYALDSTAFDGIRANFDVQLSGGPDPVAAGGVALEKVGEMQIDFLTCTLAIANYEMGETTGQKQLVSLIPADDCID